MGTLTRYEPKGLGQTMAASFALHVLAIAIGLLLFNSNTKKIFFSPVYTVNLVETAPGATKGATPGATKTPARAAPLKAPEPKTVKTPVEAKTVKVSAKKVAIKKGVTAVPSAKTALIDTALKRVAEKVRKAEDSSLVASRIEKLKERSKAESLEVQKGIEDIRKAIGETALNGADGPPGTNGSPGTDGSLGTSGSPGTATPEGGGLNAHRSALTASNIDVEFPEYMVMLRDRVQENWSYPEAYRRTDLKMIVSIKISRDGKLVSVWVERSSGNARFDNSLINAIKKAAPFKPLPEGFEGALLETGLRFCPECGD